MQPPMDANADMIKTLKARRGWRGWRGFGLSVHGLSLIRAISVDPRRSSPCSDLPHDWHPLDDLQAEGF